MSDSFRIGHGYDLHRLKAGGTLVLGGVVVAEGISPVAHSDGDVVIHAIVDATLGALGLGDIGEHFPDTDAAYKNAASEVFLRKTREHADRAGFVVSNCDVLILAERPKLKPFKPQMKARLEELLGGPVNIKAGTNEGCGEIGRGEAIAAHAVVLLARRDG
jgi:2-C-methyl-D-erythritol 2,4-cyclodiphosphate synthase